jgi:hypothetical protein
MFGKKKEAEVTAPVGETPVVRLGIVKKEEPVVEEEPRSDVRELLSDVAKRKGFIEEETGKYWLRLDDALEVLKA